MKKATDMNQFDPKDIEKVIRKKNYNADDALDELFEQQERRGLFRVKI